MKAFKIISLVLYIIFASLIIIFACCNGNISSSQSNGLTAFIVKCLPFLEDTEQTRAIIRKLIGHFGLFMVMGVFSTFTYFLWIVKRSNLAIIINVLQGIALASISEAIQLLVPGRAGAFSDVCIDLGGFFLGMVISTIIYIVVMAKRLPKEE